MFPKNLQDTVICTSRNKTFMGRLPVWA